VLVSQEISTEIAHMATKAIAYYRTSSASNVGADKDSGVRQRVAVKSFADRAGFEIVDSFYDAAVSGADPIETRVGFSALLDRIESNGVRTVIVESPDRFARDLVTQELGVMSLVGRGVRVLTASGDDLTNTDDPFKVAMRQVAGAFAQLEKARLVAKLKGARDRKRRETGKCGGRKNYAERAPETVVLAKRLARYSRKGHERSLRDIAAELAAQGHVNTSGRPYEASAIKRMLEARA
jgi:DNA invertase Pin-like site-specific DNA recombinase